MVSSSVAPPVEREPAGRLEQVAGRTRTPGKNRGAIGHGETAVGPNPDGLEEGRQRLPEVGDGRHGRLAVIDDDRDGHRRLGGRDAQDLTTGAVLANDDRVGGQVANRLLRFVVDD